MGTDRITLDVDDETPATWSVSEDRTSLGLTRRDGSQDGVWNIAIQGTDEAGNTSSASVAKWEFDSQANDGVDPVRGGTEDAPVPATVKLEVETQPVIFLSLTFKNEVDEYDARGKDSAKTIAITAVTLETLDAAGKVVADSAKELDAGVVQTSDGQRFVIALTEDAEGNPVAPIGSYQLALDYSDVAGNTDDYDFKFSVIAQVPAKIAVSPGWNLISIPGAPQTKSIGDVLDKSAVTEVWGFNNDSKRWEFARKNDDGSWDSPILSQLFDGRAYFVRSTTFDPIEVLTQRFDPQRVPPQYPVFLGWNAIGYTPAGTEKAVAVDAYLSSLGTSGWGMIRMWNNTATPPRYESYYSSGTATEGFPTDCDRTPGDCDGVAEMTSGTGYLLFATRNGVIGG